MSSSERCLSFTAGMAAAIGEGRKTMTRRALAPSKVFVDRKVVRRTSDAWGGLDWARATVSPDHQQLHVAHHLAPGGVVTLTSRVFPGSSVICKEPVAVTLDGRALYQPGWSDDTAKHYSSRYMPKRLARFRLTIGAVRFERLQDISRGDAMEEGCPFTNMAGGPSPRDWFRDLWDSINGPGAWAANPFVLVIPFTPSRLELPDAV